MRISDWSSDVCSSDLLWHEVTDAELERLLAERAQEGADTLYLFGRRKLGSLNRWMHNVARLVRSEKPTLLMHPDDARDPQIANGAPVRIRTALASLQVDAEPREASVRGSAIGRGTGRERGGQDGE